MEKENGVFLAASFSHGCDTANRLGITPTLKEYVDTQGKSHSEEEIKEALSKLISYLFYRIISRANDIADPFDVRVVKAHWLGNELLEKVKPIHISKIAKEFEEKGWDRVTLAYALKPTIEKGGYLHHNIYARHNESCSVSIKNGWFYHLEKPRLKASQEDIENLRKYGED